MDAHSPAKGPGRCSSRHRPGPWPLPRDGCLTAESVRRGPPSDALPRRYVTSPWGLWANVHHFLTQRALGFIVAATDCSDTCHKEGLRVTLIFVAVHSE